MSVVAATKTPARKLKKASAVLLLVSSAAIIVGIVAYTVQINAVQEGVSGDAVLLFATYGMLLGVGGLLTLFASAVVRIIAAIKA